MSGIYTDIDRILPSDLINLTAIIMSFCRWMGNKLQLFYRLYCRTADTISDNWLHRARHPHARHLFSSFLLSVSSARAIIHIEYSYENLMPLLPLSISYACACVVCANRFRHLLLSFKLKPASTSHLSFRRKAFKSSYTNPFDSWKI